MKIAAHITFFYIESRCSYLEQVIEGLKIPDHEITIHIYTNSKKVNQYSSENIIVHQYNYGKFGKRLGRYEHSRLLSKLGLTFLINPYFLTWENRSVIEKIVDDYDVQIYLEDDIKFNSENLYYWLKYNEMCLQYDYNLNFLRIEKDEANNTYLTDITKKLCKTIEIEKTTFLINDDNPYHGFWIYDKKELAKFIKSKEWEFDTPYYQPREKSAIGWHGLGMYRFKGSLIPLVRDSNGKLHTAYECQVHHLPNNYIGDSRMCTIKSPIYIEDN
jgi:hypothetical protein